MSEELVQRAVGAFMKRDIDGIHATQRAVRS
jgi:hypothetical protein